MLIREQKVFIVFEEGDRYMRTGPWDWYLFINHTWEYIPYVECLELEEKFLDAKSRNL